MLNLDQFIGSETFTRWTPLSRSVLTEGTKYVAEKAGAFWLFDAIDSHLTTKGVTDDTEFVVAELIKLVDNTAILYLSNGNEGVWKIQEIPYTDFPKDNFKTYAVFNGTAWTHMLPSEY